MSDVGAEVDQPPVCVTHHHACDCREWRINELVRDLQEQLRQAKADAYLSADDAVEWRARAERWRAACTVYRKLVPFVRLVLRNRGGLSTWEGVRWVMEKPKKPTHQASDGAG